MKDSAEGVAQAFVRAINRQDVDALAELMTPEHRFVDSLGNVVQGREKMRTGWIGYFRMVPDYTIAVEESFCDGPVVVMLGVAQGTFVRPREGGQSPHSSEQDLLAGELASPRAPAYEAEVGQLPKSQGRALDHPEPRAENQWNTPAAFRVFIEDGLVAEWRVYADNEPIRERMRKIG
jgi:hypothetical protein